MANGKSKSSTTARRREVRKSVPRPGPKWVQALRRREVVWAGVFIAMLVAVAGPVAIWLGGSDHYYPGQVLTDPVTVRVAFEREDVERTKELRQAAKENLPATYIADQSYYDALKNRLNDLLSLADYNTVNDAPAEFREQIKLTDLVLHELKGYITNKEPTPQWEADTRRFLQEMFELAVLDPEDNHPSDDPVGMMPITIVHPDPVPGKAQEQRLFGRRILTLTDTERLEKEIEFATRFIKGEHLRESIVALVMQHPQATYHYDPKLSSLRGDEAAAAVDRQVVTYQPGTVLIPSGKELTRDDVALIHGALRAYKSSLSDGATFLVLFGRLSLILMVGVAVWTYIFYCNERIVRNPMRGLAITSLLLLCQCMAVALARAYPQLFASMTTLPVLMAATVLVIVYDQRFALAMGGFLGLLILLSVDLRVEHVLVMMSGVGVAVALLREVRSRSKLVTVGLWAGLAMATTSFLVSVMSKPLNEADELWRITIDSAAMVVTGLLAVGIVQWALPAIEKIFKVTTAMTLKELNDASHPLLQRLAQEAPGTYQHSLRIADMAEAAADTIGADGLFCRVGAMYHDIGKINKPMYFIENQGGGPNRHDKLTPAMSLLIIVGHVKDGIEMAREYALPPTLRHFIESHHGTTLVEYFFHAAKKQTEAESKPGPSEFEFRYPGPKPQTKEAAIMLLCDCIEGAARALPEPTPVRLEQVVNAMARKRLMDGQFDECNLTLSELHKIEQSIIKTLCAVYHGRIAYPSAQKPQQTPPASAPAVG
ncbi:MAG: HDIG domain-containing protein [Phycisphaerales bacterium]